MVSAIAGGAALAKVAGMVMAYGCCLGFGFWVSRKVTDQLDMLLVLNDKELMQQLRG